MVSVSHISLGWPLLQVLMRSSLAGPGLLIYESSVMITGPVGIRSTVTVLFHLSISTSGGSGKRCIPMVA